MEKLRRQIKERRREAAALEMQAKRFGVYGAIDTAFNSGQEKAFKDALALIHARMKEKCENCGQWVTGNEFCEDHCGLPSRDPNARCSLWQAAELTPEPRVGTPPFRLKRRTNPDGSPIDIADIFREAFGVEKAEPDA